MCMHASFVYTWSIGPKKRRKKRKEDSTWFTCLKSNFCRSDARESIHKINAHHTLTYILLWMCGAAVNEVSDGREASFYIFICLFRWCSCMHLLLLYLVEQHTYIHTLNILLFSCFARCCCCTHLPFLLSSTRILCRLYTRTTNIPIYTVYDAYMHINKAQYFAHMRKGICCLCGPDFFSLPSRFIVSYFVHYACACMRACARKDWVFNAFQCCECVVLLHCAELLLLLFVFFLRSFHLNFVSASISFRVSYMYCQSQM